MNISISTGTLEKRFGTENLFRMMKEAGFDFADYGLDQWHPDRASVLESQSYRMSEEETAVKEFFLADDVVGGLVAHTWTDEEAVQRSPADEVRDVQFQEVFASLRQLYGGLTLDGQVLCLGEYAPYQNEFENGPYVDIDNDWQLIAAVRADGRVDAATKPGRYDGSTARDACRTETWECVIKVATGTNHTLGLRDDGRVYYAGPDNAHMMQVESWTDVVDIAAGNNCSVALKRDGSVVMAGTYRAYDR